jgi:hypothetical protein
MQNVESALESATRFSDFERRLLLRERGLGDCVIERLEEAGYGSIRRLHEIGVDAVVQAICAAMGSCAWGNRRRALHRAVASAIELRVLD